MSLHVNPENLCVILVEPTHPGNIGATARAMANMGVADLRLVLPKDYSSDTAIARAAHGLDVLENASVFDNLADALQDLQWVCGTTARSRSKQDRAVLLSDIANCFPSQPSRMGLMFGRESSGLTNEELARCSTLIHIPTHGKATSLNLSHAVMVTLYEVARFYGKEKERRVVHSIGESARATIVELAGLRSHLESVLTQTQFLKSHQETGIMERFDDFFARAQPTENDVRMWRGMLHRMEVTIRRSDEK